MKDRSSFTAEAVLAARAFGSTLADPSLRNPDYLAPRIVGGVFRWLLMPGVRRGFLKSYERRAPGAFGFLQARTRYFDQFILEELHAGAVQAVLLGAGFDTRPYRFAEAFAGKRVFEVDHPATGAEKRRRMTRVLGALPENVIYVSVDFVRERIRERLVAHGFDPSARTVFLWEGVVMYLDATAVDATLEFVGSTAPGSTVAFDFIHHAGVHAGDQAQRDHQAYVAKLGEPYTFPLDPGDIASLLARHGLELVEQVGARDLADRFLPATSAGAWGPIPPHAGVARARRAVAGPIVNRA